MFRNVKPFLWRHRQQAPLLVVVLSYLIWQSGILQRTVRGIEHQRLVRESVYQQQSNYGPIHDLRLQAPEVTTRGEGNDTVWRYTGKCTYRDAREQQWSGTYFVQIGYEQGKCVVVDDGLRGVQLLDGPAASAPAPRLSPSPPRLALSQRPVTAPDPQVVLLRAITLPGTSSTTRVNALAFSPDGEELAVACADGTVRLGSPESGELDAAISGGKIRDLHGNEDPGLTGRIESVAFSPDGRLLAYGVAGDGYLVCLWDVKLKRVVRSLRISDTYVRVVLAFCPDGGRLITSGPHGSVAVWDVASGHRDQLTGLGGETSAVAVSPSGKLIAGGTNEGGVKLWDAASHALLGSLPSSALALAFSPDGETLAVGGGPAGTPGSLQLWEVATRQLRDSVSGHLDQVSGVAFSPTGDLLATTCADGKVRVWDPDRPDTSRSLDEARAAATAIAFSQDGSLLASADEAGKVTIWQVY